ncbi:MAG: HNH endonuclease [Armatimonadetes bacterium]|nr:HNH endonuclease [Armatimonadota bacterium]
MVSRLAKHHGMDMRTCTRCNKTFELSPDNFYYHKNRRGDKVPQKHCKQCEVSRVADWRARNLEHHQEYIKNYRETNKVRIKQVLADYYQRNRETKDAYSAEWCQANPEARRAIARRWAQRNKDKINAKTHNYRARKQGAEGSHTDAELVAILEQQGYLCYWCDLCIEEKYEADHYIPLSRGGTNYSSNIVMSCRRCNASKADLLPDEFVEKRSLVRPPAPDVALASRAAA